MHCLPCAHGWFTQLQAEEEAARKEAEELPANPVKRRVRKLAASGASPKEIVAELGTIDAEGGQIGRTRILYEVRLLTCGLPGGTNGEICKD